MKNFAVHPHCDCSALLCDLTCISLEVKMTTLRSTNSVFPYGTKENSFSSEYVSKKVVTKHKNKNDCKRNR